MRRSLLLVVLLASVVWVPSARAVTPLHAGSLDLSFGTRGMVDLPRVGQISDRVVVDTRGRLLVVTAGEGFEVRRFGTDGRPDRRFGRRGLARVSPAGFDGNARIELAAVRADGRIIVAGTTRGDAVAAIRLLDDGRPDPGFAEDGLWQRAPFGATAGAFTLRPGGGLAVAGAALRSGGPIGSGGLVGDPLLLALGPDGRPDRAIGVDGQIQLDPGTGSVVALRAEGPNLRLLDDPAPQGRVLTTTRVSPAGAVLSRSTTTLAGDRSGDVLLRGDRVIAPALDGVLASRLGGGPLQSFGTGGLLRLVDRGPARVAGLATDPQGRLLVGTLLTGVRSGSLRSAARPLRLRADGTRDPSFTAPLVPLPLGQRSDAQDLTTDTRGRLITLTTGGTFFDRDDVREPGSTLLRFRTRAPLARLTAATFTVRRSGLVTLRVRCAGPSACRGTVTLGGRSASFGTAARRTTSVRLRLARTRRPTTTRATSVARVRSGGRSDTVGETIRLVRR